MAAQSFTHYTHYVMFDGEEASKLAGVAPHANLRLAWLPRESVFGDNIRRELVNNRVTDGYVLYLDDDNYLYSPASLAQLAGKLTELDPDFAIVPQLRGGALFMPTQCGICKVDMGNIVHKKVIRGVNVRFPNGNGYCTDGLFSEALEKLAKPVYLASLDPVVVYPRNNSGAMAVV